MKLLTLFTLVFIFIACNKDVAEHKINTEIENVTGINWELSNIRKTGDYYINPIPIPWHFRLNTDGSFEFNLRDSVSTGVYTWTAIDSLNATVKFTVQSWNFPPLTSEIAGKLRSIIDSVRYCELRKYPFTTDNPNYMGKPSLELQFKGSGGEFRVSKWP